MANFIRIISIQFLEILIQESRAKPRKSIDYKYQVILIHSLIQELLV